MIFNENLCRIAEQYLKKGSKVFIEGQLQTRKWQDQSGQDRYSTEVVLQGFRGELTLLDRAGGAGGGDLASDDSGGEFGSTGPTRKVAAAGAGGAARARIWMTRSPCRSECSEFEPYPPGVLRTPTSPFQGEIRMGR